MVEGFGFRVSFFVIGLVGVLQGLGLDVEGQFRLRKPGLCSIVFKGLR